MQTKICSKCGIEKELTEFYILSKVSLKYAARCKVCLKEKSREYTINNKESISTNKKRYHKEHKEAIKEYGKNYREVNKDKIRQTRKEIRVRDKEKLRIRRKLISAENRERRRKSHRSYYARNRRICVQRSLNYYQRNKEKVNKRNNDYVNRRMSTDPLFKLSKRLRTLMYMSISSKNYTKRSKTQQLIGCSFIELVTYIGESPHSNCHLDHKCPCSQAVTEEELLKLQHYSNLRWLASEDNLSKGDRPTPEGIEMCRKLLGREWIYES